VNLLARLANVEAAPGNVAGVTEVPHRPLFYFRP
jgi:hypothetical protein